MPGVNTTTQVANLIPSEFFLSADTTYEQGAVAKNTFRSVPGPTKKGQTIVLSKFGRWNAYEFSPGSSIEQYQQFNITRVTIVPKHIAIHTVIDDWADHVNTENLDSFAGTLFGDALTRFEDIDCLNLLDASAVSIGSGSTPRIVHFYEGEAYIDGNDTEPVQGTKVLLAHPYSLRVIAQDIAGLDGTTGSLVTTTASVNRAGDGAMRDAMLQQFMMKKLAGLEIIKAGNLPISGGVAKGAIYVKNKTFVHVPWQSLKMETQRDINIQGDHMVGVVRYGRAQHLTYGAVELNWTASTNVS